MRRMIILIALSIALSACKQQPLHIVTTGDIHGAWFADSYVEEDRMCPSLMSVKAYVDSLRADIGKQNVLLLDAGDCLQGDNASYYYNYIDTLGVHPFVEIMDYMGYDAIAVGNHDIETGHKVYDKVQAQFKERGLSWLAANAVYEDSREPYFAEYKIIRKGGRKIAVMGFTNANMKSWLSEAQWKGIDFLSLLPYVQECADRIRAEEKPDLMIALLHSGVGKGDGQILENQGLDLLNSLKGVDLIICGHDHRPLIKENNGTWLVDAGARANSVAHIVVSSESELSRNIESEVVELDKSKLDAKMRERFKPHYNKVKEFTLRKIGSLDMDMRSRDAYKGMCDYINLIQTVLLGVEGVQVSIAAPLTFDGVVEQGDIIYNDMFTIYPFENKLTVMKLQGKEIKAYLEYSYDAWIQTGKAQVLKIKSSPDARTGAKKWSFVNRAYNFDSAAGIVYTVDVTKPCGNRINISTLADESDFDMEAWYNVALTSYRANGGGGFIKNALGLSKEQALARIVAQHSDIRDIVYDFITTHERIDSQLIGNKSIIGEWRFIPEGTQERIIEDLKLVF